MQVTLVLPLPFPTPVTHRTRGPAIKSPAGEQDPAPPLTGAPLPSNTFLVALPLLAEIGGKTQAPLP